MVAVGVQEHVAYSCGAMQSCKGSSLEARHAAALRGTAASALPMSRLFW